MYTQTHSDTHTHTIPSLTVHINGSELVVVLEMGTVVLKDSVLLRLFGQVRRHWESFHVQRGSLIEQKHTHTYTSPHRSLHLQRSANATVYSKVFSTDNSFNKFSPKNKQKTNKQKTIRVKLNIHTHTHTPLPKDWTGRQVSKLQQVTPNGAVWCQVSEEPAPP